MVFEIKVCEIKNTYAQPVMALRFLNYDETVFNWNDTDVWAQPDFMKLRSCRYLVDTTKKGR